MVGGRANSVSEQLQLDYIRLDLPKRTNLLIGLNDISLCNTKREPLELNKTSQD